MPWESACRALTREEWEAAYFLGLEVVFRDACRCNVSEQVAEGVRILEAAGYRIHRGRRGGARPPGPSSPHELSCREIADGTFDTVERARRAVRWLRLHLPHVSTRWLEGLVRVYDHLHGARPETRMPSAPRKGPPSLHSRPTPPGSSSGG